MDKLIIDNRTNRTLLDLWPYLRCVLEEGRVSNDGKQYTYATTWPAGIVIYSDLNAKSDRLTIIYDESVKRP